MQLGKRQNRAKGIPFHGDELKMRIELNLQVHELEVHDAIGALVTYFFLNSLALPFIDQCHFQAVFLQDGEMAEGS